MPRIFDNIEQQLLPSLVETIKVSGRSDFCVGYFNLRGWKQIDSYIEQWSGGEGNCCRLLVGMQKLPQDELREALRRHGQEETIDNQTMVRLKRRLAEEFREQLTYGVPTAEDEQGLRKLAKQIRSKKVVVKLFLRYNLHAKLYLLFRKDPNNPITGYLGSSNLTFAGLSKQGELNVDVLDHDATQKLEKWFEDRWTDRWCMDISEELAQIIDESWAREDLVPPYHIYVKMAYHLAQEAIHGLAESKIPKALDAKLFEFQRAAVKIAARHVSKRGGVVVGDVVGLGKTMVATALAALLEERYGWSTLIICPKNLKKMWQSYVDENGLRAKVMSLSVVQKEIKEIPGRFRIVLIDESHNLRNSDSKRYQAIKEYIHAGDCKCILLSATPYNKTYLDLANQLKLFVPEDLDLGIRPEQLIKKEFGGSEPDYYHKYTSFVRSLSAFEKSIHPEDWREIMRLFMVRRTRGFIIENYAEPKKGPGRKYLEFPGTDRRSYFPTRIPKTVKFKIGENAHEDQYAKLYDVSIVNTINQLKVPRYGLGNYISQVPKIQPTSEEDRILDGLSRAGKRLMGFCRTNLFKRLESSGFSFLLSIERHILRNYIFLYALENKKPFPVGTQDVGLLDSRFADTDSDSVTASMFEEEDEETTEPEQTGLRSEQDFKKRAEQIYTEYELKYKSRFKWLRTDLFEERVATDLKADANALTSILNSTGNWKPEEDKKLERLVDLLQKKHPEEKILIFTQFADTVFYLEEQLRKNGVKKIEGVTGGSSDPTSSAWKFSPVSNEKRQKVTENEELRVLVATDVLSEGQNLQDAAIVVNYDLPWAIIRLVQRAGRVDRIGQESESIYCYSFLPADGVERIIRLRARVRQRLQENAEIVGSDETFFEDDNNEQAIRDLFTEKAGILDGDGDDEVDLASYAYQIWKNATTHDPSLKKIIPDLPSVVFSTKEKNSDDKPDGVLVYLKTGEGNDTLAWIDKQKNIYSDSQLDILKAAECIPETPALQRREDHYDLVQKAVQYASEEESATGGALGRSTSAKYRTFERLKSYVEQVKGSLFDTNELRRALDDLYRYPLQQSATGILNRQLKTGITDEELSRLVVSLWNEDHLSVNSEESRIAEPRIICSMGLVKK
ncbi:MAG: helicase-related protein [Bacteroidota bacterium]|nr:helicase-related protein [Bacteroidota bacterium]